MISPMVSKLPQGLLCPEVLQQASFSVSEIPHHAKLDQNESPFDIPGEVKERILSRLANTSWNRYPQPKQYAAVKERFAECVGQEPSRIVLTAGCDQVILLAYWVAGGQGRRARVFEPTYPMYHHYARITRTALDRVVLGSDFEIQARHLGDAVELMFLVSPNNPTGCGASAALVKQFLAHHGMVLVDEAYADYAGRTVLPLLEDHPNLVVGRSLSKVQLAGIRLGYALGHPEVVEVMERVLFTPYHLSALQLAVAYHYDLIQPHLARRVAAVVTERTRVLERIRDLGLIAWGSQTNFLLFAVEQAGEINRRLLDQGVRLRDVSSLPGLGHHLRVTVGTAEENDLFLDALERAI